VGIADLVGERVVLAVIGDPRDDGPLDRRGSEDGEHGPHDRPRLEAAVREQPVEADRDAQAGQDVQDAEDHEVPRLQQALPRLPRRDAERQHRHGGDQAGQGPVEVLVVDGLDVGRAGRGPGTHCLRRGHRDFLR
jgi:hypothetical protein